MKLLEISIAEMEEAIKEIESEGYENVKVVSCKYWRKRL